jgi:pyruvate/2-oxoglutarate dehydrogenase complex dihydrolipoamide acyltransferase (E2) component
MNMAKMSLRRKLAIATWGAPREGNIYGKLTVDATEATAYIAHLRETTGEKVTITHLVGKAVANALGSAPGLNGFIRFGSYHQHKTVDVSFLVALEEGADLAKAKILNLDTKSVVDVAKELRALATNLKEGKDEEFEASKGLVRLMPTWVMRPVLWLTGWITSSLGIGFAPAKLSAFPFGSCIITSIGMFGLDEGFVPPTPFARVPVYVLIGAMNDRPAVRDGELVIRKQLTITATVDHRFMDGFQGGVLAKTVRSILEDPWQLDGLQGPPGE